MCYILRLWTGVSHVLATWSLLPLRYNARPDSVHSLTYKMLHNDSSLRASNLLLSVKWLYLLRYLVHFPVSCTVSGFILISVHFHRSLFIVGYYHLFEFGEAGVKRLNCYLAFLCAWSNTFSLKYVKWAPNRYYPLRRLYATNTVDRFASNYLV